MDHYTISWAEAFRRVAAVYDAARERQRRDREADTVDQYTIHVQREVIDGEVVWEAWHPALPGCRVQAATPEEAQEALADQRQAYLQACADVGHPLPPGDTNLKTCMIFVH